MKWEFPWKKKKIKINKVKDIAKIAERVYNENGEVCFVSAPGCDGDIVIRRDDNISAEAVTNYYPQIGVYEIVLGKNKEACVDETMHELSHIYRRHLKNKKPNMESFLRQEMEAWLDSSYLVENKNILANGQWLAGIGNQAVKIYRKSPEQVIRSMKKVVNNIGDLEISDKEWRIVETVLQK